MTRLDYHSAIVRLLLLTALAGVVGCASTGPVANQPPSRMPSYEEIVARYNENLRQTRQLWARAVVALRWRDDKGEHYEQGDGNLLIVLPDRVALSIGKLGHTLLWAGCDSGRYWLFDLRQQDQTRLYFGQYSVLRNAPSDQMPLPIQPRDLTQLLGIMAIDSPRWRIPQPVVWEDGCYRIDLSDGTQRVWVEPTRFRPTRIALLNRVGETVAESRLSGWESLTLAGQAPGAYPKIATRVEVSLGQREGTMTLILSDANDGRDFNRISPQAFDLDYLTQVLKPQELIELNDDDVQQIRWEPGSYENQYPLGG